MKRWHRILFIIAVSVYAFLYLPLICVALFSFNAGNSGTVWEGVSLQWYVALLQERRLIEALYNSLLVCSISTVISVLLGTLVAIGLARYNFIGKRFLSVLLHLPIVLPDIVLGIATLCFFVLVNWTLGLSSLICAHITFCTAFVALVVGSRLASYNYRIEDAARDLGATRFQIFRHVTLPMLAPGIVAGALLSFTLSFDDFTISFFTSGVGSTTLPLRIFSMLHFGVTPIVNVVSTLLIVVSFTLVVAASRLQRAPYDTN